MYAVLLECDPGTTLGGSCYRDVKNMASNLINRCNFPPENVYVLTTQQISPGNRVIGTNYDSSKNIFFVCDSVINKTDLKCLLVLISGHGFSMGDSNNDELDGRDEAINIGSKYTIDDEIYSNIVVKFDNKKSDTILILLSDTCHSGTLFDLPYIIDENGFSQLSTKRTDIFKQNNDIVSLSACADSQLSMCDVGDVTGFGGSLTTAVLNIDGVLEDLIANKNVIDVSKKIKNRLKLLNQSVVLSSSKTVIF